MHPLKAILAPPLLSSFHIYLVSCSLPTLKNTTSTIHEEILFLSKKQRWANATNMNCPDSCIEWRVTGCVLLLQYDLLSYTLLFFFFLAVFYSHVFIPSIWIPSSVRAPFKCIPNVRTFLAYACLSSFFFPHTLLHNRYILRLIAFSRASKAVFFCAFLHVSVSNLALYLPSLSVRRNATEI